MLPDTISPVHVHPGLRYGRMGTKNVQLVLHISAKQVKRDVARFTSHEIRVVAGCENSC